MLIVVIALIVIGASTAGYFGRLLTRSVDAAVVRMPVVRSVYVAVKQIMETVLAQKSHAFRQAVLVQYPREGVWTIAFVTGVTQGEVRDLTQRRDDQRLRADDAEPDLGIPAVRAALRRHPAVDVGRGRTEAGDLRRPRHPTAPARDAARGACCGAKRAGERRSGQGDRREKSAARNFRIHLRWYSPASHSGDVIMHYSARGSHNLFEIFITFTFLSCGLMIPTAAGAEGSRETAVAAAEDAELLRLAEASQGSFPPPHGAAADRDHDCEHSRADRTAIIRDHARELYEAAIDVLLAEARTPERASGVKAALRQLVNIGEADIAEAIFKEILERKAAEGDDAKRDAAAAARHSVALVELPAALAPVIKLPSEIVQRSGFPPLGQKAAPAYVRAAELDPDDPWTWIVLAQLADPPENFDLHPERRKGGPERR